jgi:hypothetical protein
LTIALVGASILPAQVLPGGAVVAVRRSTPPATALLAVDLLTGAVTPLPRFASDGLAPLAVAFDPVDRDLLLCVDDGLGSSMVLRFPTRLGTPGPEWTIGIVPGRVRQLVATNDELWLAVGGAQGGVWTMPRTGGGAVLRWSQPHLGAIQVYLPSWVVAAWSGDPGPPATAPGVGYVEATTGQWTLGPETWPGFTPAGITGVVDLPTALPRVILSHDDGSVSMHTLLTASAPITVPLLPTLPAGGAVAMQPLQYSTQPVVLGGVAFPYLWTFDPWGNPPVRTTLSALLPDDPVDFAIAPDHFRADLAQYGQPCGNPNLSVQVFSLPTIGNQGFAIQLGGGAPAAATLLALGFSDTLAGALPLSLPGGCPLRTSAESVWFLLTNAQGAVAQALPVPPQPGLAGLSLYGQWLQAPLGAFTSSAGQAIHVGR